MKSFMMKDVFEQFDMPKLHDTITKKIAQYVYGKHYNCFSAQIFPIEYGKKTDTEIGKTATTNNKLFQHIVVC